MHVSSDIHSPRKKYFIGAIIFVFTCFLLLLTNLSHVKRYSFEWNIFGKLFFNTTLSNTTTFTSSTTSASTITSKLTTKSSSASTVLPSTTKPSSTSIVLPSTTNLNEILCNNLTNSNDRNISYHPCEQIRCAVIIRRSDGRLGNRMFMFATAYGLARTHDCRLHISGKIMSELLGQFSIMSISENMRLPEEQLVGMTDIVVKHTICTFMPDLMRPNAFKYIELQGFWQSYLYFDAYREEIREIFIGRSDTISELSKYFLQITKEDCPSCSAPPNTSHNELRRAVRSLYNITWIGVHIRRGDFHGLGYVSNELYIYQAIAYYKRRFYRHKIRFLVASDNKPYCEKLFAVEIKANRAFILPHTFSQANDLITLSLCHHSIVTGGTFGFWTAYLAGGEVVHDIMYQAGCSRSDYYPPWFKLVGETKPAKV